MKISECVPLMLIVTGFLVLTPADGQKQLAQSPRILSAKAAYFVNQTGSDAVGKNALAQLKKWGKFQLVTDQKQADLIFLLSADPYKGGNIIFASGQTGTIENGEVTEDAVPNYNKQSPTRYAYLTVIDTKTGDNLWSDKHLWGGLLTGFNSVGERLVKQLQNQTKKASGCATTITLGPTSEDLRRMYGASTDVAMRSDGTPNSESFLLSPNIKLSAQYGSDEQACTLTLEPWPPSADHQKDGQQFMSSVRILEILEQVAPADKRGEQPLYGSRVTCAGSIGIWF